MTGFTDIKRILIVDDDKDIVALLEKIIEKEIPGCVICIEENGYGAYLQLAEQEFDLLITDVKMPAVDGISLIESIFGMKEDYEAELIPPKKILVISAQRKTNKKQFNVSKFSFISKPFSKDEISEYLKKNVL